MSFEKLTGVLASILMAAPAFGQATVTITNPANNEVVVTPTMGVDASATGSSSMYVIQIYLNGLKATQSFCNGANPCQIHTTIPITTSSSRLSVQVLNNEGGVLGKTTIFVKPTASPTVIPGIEDLSASWISCNQCGGGGGGDPVPPGNCSPPTCPSEDSNENSIQFTTFGETGVSPSGYGTSYWYIDQTVPSTSISYLKYQFDLWVPSSYATLPQALEFECQLTLGGNTYNFAWEANYKGPPVNTWRIFNYAAGTWEPSGISLTEFTGGTWHHIIAEFHVDPADPDSKPIHHDALWIDGVRMAPSENFKHAFATVGNRDEFTNAFESVMDANNDAFTVYIDRMSITYTTL